MFESEITLSEPLIRSGISDTRESYERVINRRTRLDQLVELRAPDIVVRNEQRMLRAALYELFGDVGGAAPVSPRVVESPP